MPEAVPRTRPRRWLRPRSWRRGWPQFHKRRRRTIALPMQDDVARDDDDQTIRIVRPSSAPKLRRLLPALAAAALSAAGLAAWMAVRPPGPGAPALVPATASLD